MRWQLSPWLPRCFLFINERLIRRVTGSNIVFQRILLVFKMFYVVFCWRSDFKITLNQSKVLISDIFQAVKVCLFVVTLKKNWDLFVVLVFKHILISPLMSSDVWSHIQELFKLQNEPLKRAETQRRPIELDSAQMERQRNKRLCYAVMRIMFSKS